ncbi:MAG: DUF1823 family protein, partial [Cyanobacteriota bacterium]|nr:DUF1823 family protein [Cyanobacteriota bacterium]
MELPALTTDTIWAILKDEIDDTTVLNLVWHYLGYGYDESTGKWNADNVSEEWRNEYPEPPDFIANRPPTV